MNSSKITLDEFTKGLWSQLSITPKTRNNYVGAYRVNLAPSLEHLMLDEITKVDLLNALAPLTPQTRYQTLMVCRVIFREAVERELIEASPAVNIKAPKISVPFSKFLTWHEIKQTDFGRQTDRIKFLALHGLRWGEAAVLTEDDIYDGLVHITKSKYGPTKTTAGTRTVPYLGCFEPFPLNAKAVARALRPYGVTVHSLRKTYAYILKSSNVHVTTGSKLMGHSSPLVTLKIYTAVLDDEINATGQILKLALNL